MPKPQTFLLLDRIHNLLMIHCLWNLMSPIQTDEVTNSVGKSIASSIFQLLKNYQNLFVSFPSRDPAGR